MIGLIYKKQAGIEKTKGLCVVLQSPFLKKKKEFFFFDLFIYINAERIFFLK